MGHCDGAKEKEKRIAKGERIFQSVAFAPRSNLISNSGGGTAEDAESNEPEGGTTMSGGSDVVAPAAAPSGGGSSPPPPSPLPSKSLRLRVVGLLNIQSAAAFASPPFLRRASLALPIPHPVREHRSASFFAISIFDIGDGFDEAGGGPEGERVEEGTEWERVEGGKTGGNDADNARGRGGGEGDDMDRRETADGLQADSSIGGGGANSCEERSERGKGH